jgi:hypothetical protein
VERAIVGVRNPGADHPRGAQLLEQRLQRRGVTSGDEAASASVLEKLVDSLLVEIMDSEPLLAEPPAQTGYKAKVLPRGRTCVAPLRQ